MTQLHERKRSEESLSDEFQTPKTEVFHILCEKYNIYPILDVCATSENTICPFYMTRAINSLEKDWTLLNSICTVDDYLRIYRNNEVYARFINPPQSKAQVFIEKANEQYYKLNIDIMMLVPIHSTITKRGEKFIWDDDNVEIHPVLPTPRFIYQGKQLDSARNRYCVCIWRRK